MKELPKLLVIVGPTASGKTDLAVRLAKAFDGEVVSADSRLIYKGMDIGTAKPVRDSEPSPRSLAYRQAGRGPRPYVSDGVPHHLIDLVPPSKTLTAAEWKKKAVRTIRGILKRGKLPIVVGGTGLYVRSLIDNLSIPEVPPDQKLRAKLERMPREELFAWLRALDPEYAVRAGKNPRYAIRALEVIRAAGRTMTELQKSGEPLFDALQIGLKPAKGGLENRISKRVRAMAKTGLVSEVRKLAKRYGWDAPAMSGIGYGELRAYLEGRGSLEEALRAIRLRTRQYAKRQMTWFKRDKRIRWISGQKKALKIVEKWLKKGKNSPVT